MNRYLIRSILLFYDTNRRFTMPKSTKANSPKRS